MNLPRAAHRPHPGRPRPAPRARRRAGGLAPAALPWAVALALGALLWAAAAPAADAPPQAAPELLEPRRAGEEVRLADCLRFSVLEFTDRNGPLEPVDWVTVRVENDCPEPVRHVLVDLLLVDVTGEIYGASLWVLERGEVLWSGRAKRTRLAVPDPAERLPRRWAVRLRRLETPTVRIVDGAVLPQPRRRGRASAPETPGDASP